MSTKSDIVAALIEPAIAAARWLWHKAHGEDTKPDEAELKRIAIAGLTAQLQRAELELQRLAAVANVAIAADELARALLELREAMREAEKGGGLPRILDGAQIEYVHVPLEGVCRNCGASDLALPCSGPR